MLELKNINLNIGGFSIESVNLFVGKGDYFVLAGPSGAGKTLILETIAGINKPDKGQILLNGKDISGLRMGKRGIGLVFQDNTSFPHLSVKKNIEYALKLLKVSDQEIAAQIEELAGGLGISHLLHRMPSTLSGGELQRVILARTLASKPLLLLLDEPLSSVDAAGKDHLKTLLRNLNRKGQTIIHVTHDFEEAISLANKAGIMLGGKIIEQGKVENIFYSPKNEFTARFCGYKNFFYATIEKNGEVRISDKIKFKLQPPPEKSQRIALLLPENIIKISNQPFAETGENIFKGIITDITRTISGFSAEVDVGIILFVHLSLTDYRETDLSNTRQVWIRIKSSDIKVIDVEK